MDSKIVHTSGTPGKIKLPYMKLFVSSSSIRWYGAIDSFWVNIKEWEKYTHSEAWASLLSWSGILDRRGGWFDLCSVHIVEHATLMNDLRLYISSKYLDLVSFSLNNLFFFLRKFVSYVSDKKSLKNVSSWCLLSICHVLFARRRQ